MIPFVPDTSVTVPKFTIEDFRRSVKKREAYFWNGVNYDPLKEYKIYVGRLVRATSRNAQHTNMNRVEHLDIPVERMTLTTLPKPEWRYKQILMNYVWSLNLPPDYYIIYFYTIGKHYLYAQEVKPADIGLYRKKCLGISSF